MLLSKFFLMFSLKLWLLCQTSVGDPDPRLDPQDPYVFGVFGPPGSASGIKVSQTKIFNLTC